MMGYGFMGGWGFGGLLSSLNELVWLAVGILLVVWLWRQVKNK
jgi:hypothetical protein